MYCPSGCYGFRSGFPYKVHQKVMPLCYLYIYFLFLFLSFGSIYILPCTRINKNQYILKIKIRDGLEASFTLFEHYVVEIGHGYTARA